MKGISLQLKLVQYVKRVSLKLSDHLFCFLRLENTQYDASNGVGDDGDFGNSPMSASPSLWSADRKPNQDDSTGD